jgi:hypothetical protein
MTKAQRLHYLKRTYPTTKPTDKLLDDDIFVTELDTVELAQFLKGETNE